MRRDALSVLMARGFASALSAWKALILVLVFNAVLALALVAPISGALHAVLDHHPDAASLTHDRVAVFYGHLQRNHPDVLRGLDTWDDIASGESVKANLLAMGGPGGALLWLGLASALAASICAGGFSGRFGASRDAGSLSAFGGDAGRFAFSSLVLGALAITAIVGLYRLVYLGTGSLYEASELRYEWEAVSLVLVRLLAFLLLAGCVRLVVLYARASIGLSRNGNPFLALASGMGFVLGRPFRTFSLELAFGAVGLLPLLLWGLLAPTWDGSDPARFWLFLAAQELVVLFRITARVAHLGAATSFMRRAKETVPAAEKVDAEPPADTASGAA